MTKSTTNKARPWRLAKCSKLLADAAEQRGFEVTTYPNISTTVIKLKMGSHEEIISESAMPALTAVMYRIVNDKALTAVFLRELGYKVPREILTDSITEARKFLAKVKRIVVKPNNLTWGLGVFTNITNDDELDFSFKNALASNTGSRSADAKVICQEHLAGDEYRVLVIDKKHVFVLRRVSARVVGDGVKTIAELLTERNQQEPVPIELNELVLRILQQQSLTPQSIPQKNQLVSVAAVANAHSGGSTEDATDEIGPDAVRQACELANQLNMPIVGIDCFSQDISKDLGYIIELNSTPDIALHHSPTVGKARDVAGTILQMLFPEAKLVIK